MTLHELQICETCGYYHYNAWSRTRGADEIRAHPESTHQDAWIAHSDITALENLPSNTYVIDKDGDLWLLPNGGRLGNGDIPALLYSNDDEYDCGTIGSILASPGYGATDATYGPYLVIHSGRPTLDVPKFASLAEAEEWLEAHA